ncbi:MAG: hypothetical protein ABI306_02300, partial [Caulobacteraceae bacterium]
MSYLAACLILLASTAAAAGASWVIGAFVGIETRRRHHEVGHPVFLQVGVMFSVLLAFVFSEVWGEFDTAAQAINAECGALHGAAMLAGALPAGQGLPVEKAIATYAATVVRGEWPAMAHGRGDPAAEADFHAMLNLGARLTVTAPADVSNQAQILALIAQAHAAR